MYIEFDKEKAKEAKIPDSYKVLEKINEMIHVVKAKRQETKMVLKKKELNDQSRKVKEKIKFAYRALSMLSHPFII